MSRNIFDNETEFQKWWTIQEQRKLDIEKTCQKYGSSIHYNIQRDNLMHDPNHKLLFCRNAKVRSDKKFFRVLL